MNATKSKTSKTLRSRWGTIEPTFAMIAQPLLRISVFVSDPDLHKLEKYAFSKLFQTPYNVVSHMQQFSFNSLGVETFRSLDLTSAAAKVRYLHSHLAFVSDLHAQLLNSIDSLPLNRACDCCSEPWDSPFWFYL